MSDTLDVQRVFPQSVHDSLAELRRIARAATSRNDPALRRATEDEIALAKTLHKPTQCSAHSNRTGLPCFNSALNGMTVCRLHGGSARHTKHAMYRRLADAAPKLLESQILRAISTEDGQVGHKASQDLLDRFGFGALVQARVRASKREQQGGAQVVVNIGFLG